MSSRVHLGLRLSGLLLLLAVTVWPRARGEHRDRAASRVATPAHLAVTTAARLLVEDTARERTAHAVHDDEDAIDAQDAPATDTTLTN